MRLPIRFAALVLAVPLLAAQADDARTLLDGVKTIAITGTPGPICCTAPEAIPLVAGGHDKQVAPIVAATRLKRGRAVFLGHNGYFGRRTLDTADTGRLMLNALRWTGAGKAPDGKPRVGCRRAGDLARWLAGKGFETVALDKGDWTPRLETCDVLAIEAGAFGAAAELAAVRSFVEGGGGIVTAVCPWGWAQVTRKNLRTELPANRLLAAAGIVASDGYIRATADRGFRVDATPDPMLNAHSALDALEAAAKGDKGRLARAAHIVTIAARALPPDDTRLLPRLRALAKTHGEKALPMPNKPLRSRDGLARVLVAVQENELRTLLPERISPHPAAKGFPYAVPDDAPRVTRDIRIDTKQPDWHSTGLYAAPGEMIELTVPESSAGKGLGIRISPHKDQIWHHDTWKRWPQISWAAPLDGAKTRIANPFGGLVYVTVPRRNPPPGPVTVTIAKAVEAPYYVLGKTSDADWKASIRSRPAPWAELECPGIILTVPAKVVRDLEDPKGLMTFWDRVVRAQDELAQWKPEERLRPERMVCDQQISAGYMHAGYPIMTHLDVAATNVSVSTITTKGGKGWGQWHELGHNHQDRMWTPGGSGEVTVNLFTLYVMTQIHGLPLEDCRGSLHKDQRLKAIRAYLNSSQTPANWGAFTGLTMHYHLIDAFGWDALKKVIRQYRDLSRSQRPRNDTERWSQWMVRYAKTAGKNLGPFFQKWKAPVTRKALDEIKLLPAWMHQDFKALAGAKS